jgi:hypothetical protein
MIEEPKGKEEEEKKEAEEVTTPHPHPEEEKKEEGEVVEGGDGGCGTCGTTREEIDMESVQEKCPYPDSLSWTGGYTLF